MEISSKTKAADDIAFIQRSSVKTAIKRDIQCARMLIYHKNYIARPKVSRGLYVNWVCNIKEKVVWDYFINSESRSGGNLVPPAPPKEGPGRFF